jgi:hypothetical protein
MEVRSTSGRDDVRSAVDEFRSVDRVVEKADTLVNRPGSGPFVLVPALQRWAQQHRRLVCQKRGHAPGRWPCSGSPRMAIPFATSMPSAAALRRSSARAGRRRRDRRRRLAVGRQGDRRRSDGPLVVPCRVPWSRPKDGDPSAPGRLGPAGGDRVLLPMSNPVDWVGRDPRRVRRQPLALSLAFGAAGHRRGDLPGHGEVRKVTARLCPSSPVVATAILASLINSSTFAGPMPTRQRTWSSNAVASSQHVLTSSSARRSQ